MCHDPRSDFAQAVRASLEIPEWARNEVASVRELESKVLDQSYLDFLDDMIAREPRGPEWAEVLRRRRAALTEYCGKLLVDGIIGGFKQRIFVKVDPVTHKVLYWEEWPVDVAELSDERQ